MGKRFKQGTNPGKLHIECGQDSLLGCQTINPPFLSVSEGDLELSTTEKASTKQNAIEPVVTPDR
jgi:hypothetical protein